MQGIPGIGSKTQRNETTGPMGMKNIFYDYEKDPQRSLKWNCILIFRGMKIKKCGRWGHRPRGREMKINYVAGGDTGHGNPRGWCSHQPQHNRHKI